MTKHVILVIDPYETRDHERQALIRAINDQFGVRMAVYTEWVGPRDGGRFIEHYTIDSTARTVSMVAAVIVCYHNTMRYANPSPYLTGDKATVEITVFGESPTWYQELRAHQTEEQRRERHAT